MRPPGEDGGGGGGMDGTDDGTDDGDADEQEDESDGLKPNEGTALRLGKLEALFAPVLEDIDRCSRGHSSKDGYISLVFGDGSPALWGDLGVLLRLQWLHVRCLAIASKDGREALRADLVAAFGASRDAKALLVATLPSLGHRALGLPGKLQGRMAAFMGSAFLEASAYLVFFFG